MAKQEVEFYDNTVLGASRTCERKLYFRHIEHLTQEGSSPPLAFGSAWHSAMDMVWQQIGAEEVPAPRLADVIQDAYDSFVERWVAEGMKHPSELSVDDVDDLQPRTPGNALDMIAEYVMARRDYIRRFRILGIEQPFAVPLHKDKTDLWYCGRFDKLLEEKDTGDVWVMDHKTTTSYKKDGYFRSDFIAEFSPNTQMDGYAYGARLLYPDRFKGIIVDATLVHKTVHEGFGLIELKPPHDQMEAWHWETMQQIARIKQGKAALEDFSKEILEMSYMPAFPRNTRNCYDFMRPCAFIDICQVEANPYKMFRQQGIPSFLTVKPWSPFDELQLEKIGLTKGGEK